jgi:hypothetical protein
MTLPDPRADRAATPEYALTGVVHLVRPVHRQAESLEELRDGIAAVEPASLFYHAVQHVLRTPIEDDVPADDFSAWAHGVVQDREAAERLALARLEGRAGPEPLRVALLAALEAMSPAARRGHDAPAGGAFAFLAADSVPVPHGEPVADAGALLDALAQADTSVWFQELIESAWGREGDPPVVRWLRERGHRREAEWLAEAAGSGLSIVAMRRQVTARWRRRALGRRVADAGRDTETRRREVGRATMARWARRVREDGPA